MASSKKTALDKKDRRILNALDSNARQSCSAIAKNVGLSSEVVNYRIKRLEQEGVITAYQLVVNLAKLHIVQFKICLCLEHLRSGALDAILLKLKGHPAIKWIVTCNGRWDIVLSLETDSLVHVDALKDEVLHEFEGHVREKALSILIEATTYPREYLVSDKREWNASRSIMKKDAAANVDDLDMALLKALSGNARMSIVDLAAQLKSTPRAVNYRLKQLVKRKIVLGFKIAINHELVGVRFYKTFIHLENPDKEQRQRLMQSLAQNPYVIHTVKVLGTWDLEPEFEVPSDHDFDEMLSALKDEFSQAIKTIDIITISKEHKFVYF